MILFWLLSPARARRSFWIFSELAVLAAGSLSKIYARVLSVNLNFKTYFADRLRYLPSLVLPPLAGESAGA